MKERRNNIFFFFANSSTFTDLYYTRYTEHTSTHTHGVQTISRLSSSFNFIRFIICR